jgi:hypothetical protein
MELPTYFKGLLHNIEPDPKAVAIAVEAHETLRTTLHTDTELSKADPDTYLSGSYARDTALKRIKDVDVILLLDIDHTVTEPEVVLAWVHGVVQGKYSETRPQGRSICVTTGRGFDLDIVPAVPVSHRDGAVRIPDRDAKQWVLTNPKGQLDFSIKRNASTDGFYKPVVKMMKHWRDRLPDEEARAKSYIVESIVAGCLLAPPQSHAAAFVSVLQSIGSSYSLNLALGSVPRIPDPGYSSVNVTKRWKFEEFKAFIKHVSSAATAASAALKETDKNASVKAWKAIFGNDFEPSD